MATQFASVVIDQVQSRAVTIVTAPCPPAAPNADGEPLAVTAHRSLLGAVSDVSVRLHALKAPAPTAIRIQTKPRIRRRIRFTRRRSIANASPAR
jgi:hypothetical protein